MAATAELGARPHAGPGAAVLDAGPDSPPGPAAGGRWGRLAGAWRAADPIVLVAALLVLVPPAAAAISALRNPWVPTNDWALLELQVRAVGTADTPLVGVWSRFGWDHPGPLLFYALALPYRLVPDDRGLLFAAACVNLVAAAGFGFVVARFPRSRALVALGGLAVLERGLGVAGLGDPWNPTVLIVPFALYVVLCLDVAEAGRRWTVPAAAAVGCFVVQAHVGLLLPVALLGVVAGGLRVHRRHRAADGGPGAPRAWVGRAWAARRAAVPTLVVLVLAWLPPLIDQVNGQGNLGLLFRWARGEDIGGGMGPLTEGHIGLERVVRSGAWLLDPLGPWAGRAEPLRVYGTQLLGVRSPAALLWVPLVLGCVAAALRWAPMPAAYRRGAAVAALLATTGVVALLVDLMTARGAPVYWAFRWAVAVMLLLVVAVGWSAAGVAVERFPWLDAPLRRRSPDRPQAGAHRLHRAAVAGLVLVVALPVILTVGRGSLGRQPQQVASAAVQRLAPTLERYARQDDLAVANSVDLLNDKDLAVAVVLDRAGIDWVGIDDPRAVGHHRYMIATADVLQTPLVAIPLSRGEIELLARSGAPRDGEPPDSELVLLRVESTETVTPGAQ